jgi:hypothetical protein
MNLSSDSSPNPERLELEEQAKAGLQDQQAGQLRAARALKEIWDRKLWPQNLVWAKYTFTTFGIMAERTHQLISFVELRDALQGARLPDNERQTRALAQADKADWQSVWDRACKASGKRPPTSRTIERIIRQDQQEENGDNESAAEDEWDEADSAEETRPPEPERYVLDLELTVTGACDDIEEVFGGMWQIEKTEATGAADLGMKFTCPASEVPALMDSLGHVLDGAVAGMTIAIKKTEAPVRPTADCNHEVPQGPNQGCQNG